jgi:hypothetical protein
MLPILSALVVLEIGSYFMLRLAWTTIFLLYASHNHWDDRCTPPRPGFFQTFLLGLDWNCDPPNLSLLCRWDDMCTLLAEVVSPTFCLGWHCLPSISASQAGRIAHTSLTWAWPEPTFCDENASLDESMQFTVCFPAAQLLALRSPTPPSLPVPFLRLICPRVIKHR